MISIKKGKEPSAWTRRKIGGGNAGYKELTIPELKDALLQEQGYICAYCMRRIPVKDNGNTEQHRIDHVLSQKKHPEKQLDYDNMVICCPGFIDGEEHCDKAKHENNITIPIFNPAFQKSISYATKNGAIKSHDPIWDNEIDKILCLNNLTLCKNRFQALEGVRTILEKKKWTPAELQNKLDEWTKFDAQGRLKPYCGIVIWYIEKKLRQII